MALELSRSGRNEGRGLSLDIGYLEADGVKGPIYLAAKNLGPIYGYNPANGTADKDSFYATGYKGDENLDHGPGSDEPALVRKFTDNLWGDRDAGSNTRSRISQILGPWRSSNGGKALVTSALKDLSDEHLGYAPTNNYQDDLARNKLLIQHRNG